MWPLPWWPARFTRRPHAACRPAGRRATHSAAYRALVADATLAPRAGHYGQVSPGQPLAARWSKPAGSMVAPAAVFPQRAGPDRAVRGPPASKAPLASLAACAALRVCQAAPPPAHASPRALPADAALALRAGRVLCENSHKMSIDAIASLTPAAASRPVGRAATRTAVLRPRPLVRMLLRSRSHTAPSLNSERSLHEACAALPARRWTARRSDAAAIPLPAVASALVGSSLRETATGGLTCEAIAAAQTVAYCALVANATLAPRAGRCPICQKLEPNDRRRSAPTPDVACHPMGRRAAHPATGGGPPCRSGCYANSRRRPHSRGECCCADGRISRPRPLRAARCTSRAPRRHACPAAGSAT
jgi:hypothetical protein